MRINHTDPSADENLAKKVRQHPGRDANPERALHTHPITNTASPFPVWDQDTQGEINTPRRSTKIVREPSAWTAIAGALLYLRLLWKGGKPEVTVEYISL